MSFILLNIIYSILYACTIFLFYSDIEHFFFITIFYFHSVILHHFSSTYNKMWKRFSYIFQIKLQHSKHVCDKGHRLCGLPGVILGILQFPYSISKMCLQSFHDDLLSPMDTCSNNKVEIWTWLEFDYY